MATTRQKQVIGLSVILLAAVLGILRYTSRPGVAQVDIRFAGYHTNSAGERRAKFDIQNNSPFRIESSSHCFVETRGATGWGEGGRFMQPLTNGPSLLMPDGGEILEVAAPVTTSPWRLGVLYIEPESRGAALIRWVRFKLGLPYHERRKTYFFHSDPVSP